MDRDETFEKLFAAYDEYISLLAQSEKSMFGLAHVHGYQCPQNLVDRGKELRSEIERLKVAFASAL